MDDFNIAMSENKILEESKELIKKIDFPKDHKYEIIFNLLAVKNGIKTAFSWNAPNFPDGDGSTENYWTKYEMQIGDHDSVWLKELKEIIESCGLSMDLLKMSASKEFDYETLLDENPVPGTIDDVMDPDPKGKKLAKLPPSKLEELENQFSPDHNDCESTCQHAHLPKVFWVTNEKNLEKIRKNAKSMKESERKEFCGQPRCCLFWFIQRNTEILCDTITEFYGTTFDFSDKTFKNYVIHNYWRHDNYKHDERMSKLNNRKDATDKKFPFLWFPVCDRCLNDSKSPAGMLHNKLEEFLKKLSPEIQDFFRERGINGLFN